MEEAEGIVDRTGRLRACCGAAGSLGRECGWLDVSSDSIHRMVVLGRL